MAMVPSREPIVGAYREKWTAIPEIALREALANAIIHQDFSLSGSGPLVEVFDDRVEISNPGKMLVDPIRVLDTPPRSRNGKLSGLMRRLKLCEESGTGWDKMVVACELLQTCAPKIELYDDFTKVVLFSKADYEKIRRKYGSTSDSNTDVTMKSMELLLTDMENDMQLKYNIYTAMSAQMQSSEAKLQEATPAFTIIESPSIPFKPAGPRRLIISVGMMILAFIGLTGRLLMKKEA